MSHLIFRALLETFHMLGGWKTIKKNLTAIMLWSLNTAYSQEYESNSTTSQNLVEH